MTEVVHAPAVASGADELPGHRRPGATALLYSVASLGAGIFFGFSNATLPLILNRLTGNALLIGLLSSTRSIEGAIVQPIIGTMSDHTSSRIGRRRPFMAIGIACSVLLILLATRAPNLPLLACGIVAFSLCFNVAIDPYNALLADLFPVARRSAVNGLALVFQFAGTTAVVLGGAELASRDHLALVYYVVAAGMALSFAVTIAGIRESPAAAHRQEQRDDHHLRAFVGQVLQARRHRAALRYLLCLFCFRFGSNAILPYLTLFAVHVIGTDDGTAQYLFLGLVLATGLTVFPLGIVAGRLGRRPVLLAGLLLMAVAACGGMLIGTVPQTLAVIVLAGIANAAITATDWPLLTELVPPGEVGLFAGMKTAFESIAVPASVLLSSGLIALWGYRAIFSVLIFGTVAAIGILRTVAVPPRADRGA